ncbi:hypothetical protein [Paractinoplanes atraurantiacus]|nr:hypothetical protein [Actinoplanes atraurantiacus]
MRSTWETTTEAGAALIRETMAGATGLTLVSFAEIVVVSPGRPAGRAVVLAIVVGLLSALFTRWQARVAMCLMAVVVFGAVLGRESGVDPWSYTPVIVFAVALGAGYRSLAHAAPGSNYR